MDSGYMNDFMQIHNGRDMKSGNYNAEHVSKFNQQAKQLGTPSFEQMIQMSQMYNDNFGS